MSEPRIQMRCDGCGKEVTFPIADAGAVQECPECGGYLDVPTPRVPDRSDEYNRHAAESDRQLTVSARQQEETERQLQASKRHQEETERQLQVSRKQIEEQQVELERRHVLSSREELLFEKMELLVNRWVELAARFEKALGSLERKGDD